MEWREYRSKPEVEPKERSAEIEAQLKTHWLKPMEEVCPSCQGSGKDPEGKVPCQTCQGSGLTVMPEPSFFDIAGGPNLPTRSELEALEKIADVGGRIHSQRLAIKMKRNMNYVGILCKSLAHKGFINFIEDSRHKNRGICEITLKGIEDLRMRGLLKRRII